MYDLEFVKKRKRKTVAIITGIASTFGIGALITIAFMGRYIGTFTVTLDTSDVKLSLSTDKDFTNPTTLLVVNTLPAFDEWTYHDIKQKEAFLDDENSSYLAGAVYDSEEVDETMEPSRLNFFKYTFYVKNVGFTTARYSMNINIIENSPNDEDRYLDDTLRVAVYQNDADSDSHESIVYAKKRNGEGALKPISVDEKNARPSNPFYGYATNFVASDRVATYKVDGFKHGDIYRYTIIVWCEGEDPNSFSEAPEGAKIKLGVEIKAYEND